MEYREYMDTLGEQIRNARARRMVLGEIQGHIEEQCRAYEDQGMDPREAMAESIRQMGDPARTGAELDRIHRPRTPWGLIGLAVGLTAVGIIIQCLIFYKIADPPSWANVWLYHGRNTVVYNLIGLAVMLGIMYLDYSFIGRHVYLLYGLYLAGMFGICVIRICRFSYDQYLSLWYYMISLYPILLAGLIYRSRKQGMKGLAWCMILTAAVLAVCIWGFGQMTSACPEILVICGIMLLAAVHKRIFGGKRLWQGMALAGVALLGIIGIWYMTAAGSRWLSPNQYARLIHFLSPEKAAGDVGYIAVRQRELLGNYSLWGQQGLTERLLADSGPGGLDLAGTYVLSAIFAWFGIFVGVLVVGGLLFFVGKALHVTLRQRNRLGMFIGMACGLSLLLHSVVFIAINCGYSLYYTTGIPFLAYGLGYAVTNGVLVGLLLCVCRNSAILGEDTAPQTAGIRLGRHRYRLRMERMPEQNGF